MKNKCTSVILFSITAPFINNCGLNSTFTYDHLFHCVIILQLIRYIAKITNRLFRKQVKHCCNPAG